MTGDQRFAPPGARVEDVTSAHAAWQPVRLWPPTGRLGRLRMLAWGLGLYLGLIVVSLVLGFVGAMLGLPSEIAGIVGIVIYAIGLFALLIQRSHDMDMSGWWSIAALIPLVGLYWLFKGGTPGGNRWGAPPPPNGLGVKIAGLAVPVLMVVGIAVAIAVAVPAYQGYVKRAQSGTVSR